MDFINEVYCFWLLVRVVLTDLLVIFLVEQTIYNKHLFFYISCCTHTSSRLIFLSVVFVTFSWSTIMEIEITCDFQNFHIPSKFLDLFHLTRHNECYNCLKQIINPPTFNDA